MGNVLGSQWQLQAVSRPPVCWHCVPAVTLRWCHHYGVCICRACILTWRVWSSGIFKVLSPTLRPVEASSLQLTDVGQCSW